MADIASTSQEWEGTGPADSIPRKEMSKTSTTTTNFSGTASIDHAATGINYHHLEAILRGSVGTKSVLKWILATGEEEKSEKARREIEENKAKPDTTVAVIIGGLRFCVQIFLAIGIFFMNALIWYVWRDSDSNEPGTVLHIMLLVLPAMTCAWFLLLRMRFEFKKRNWWRIVSRVFEFIIMGAWYCFGGMAMLQLAHSKTKMGMDQYQSVRILGMATLVCAGVTTIIALLRIFQATKDKFEEWLERR
ncbi:uncharacterized protein BCR38DRAFT_406832 [Pseudomassariella vexata]|uniref:Uncharacterized protein n=1 Tax=Pseudomassariella vexata TaxID=1141098 RepID=A0A1Y2EDT9_9PEZI|nr:uncharacterized protein BCR38DRAFT_406832 [Pseudomassariella vexata]ORY68955.1 hypothetical protein BCR38DRAFT_406832 [Pseudomassariella vexata]